MPVRGIRGAVQVRANSAALIGSASRDLALRMMRANGVRRRDVACIIFTATDDLDADFPAYAVRRMGNGWEHVPLLCAREIAVPDSMPRLLRLLMLVESSVPQEKIRHVYLGKASKLRK